MVGSEPTGTRVSAAQIVRLGVVLTLAAAVLMSVRFARFDWTGVPLELLPHSLTVEVSPECTEQIGSYVTSSGRTIAPTAMDDQQYLAMVDLYRGTPADEIQAECLYRPYSGRFAQPWLAHFLPFEEGVSLALVNATMMIGSIWAMLLALRKQGASPRATAFAGTFFALGWNTFFYGAGVLTDPGALFVVSVGWLLAVHRRWFWCLVLMLLSIPVRETVLVLLPVVLVGLWSEWTPVGAHRDDHGSRPGRGAFVVAAVFAVAASLAAVAFWGRIGPVADATFLSEIRFEIAISNLFSPSITTVMLAAGALYLPALLRWISQVRSIGVVAATLQPAPVGLAATVLVLGWVLLGADLSPRFAWIGFAFAAAMCAEYIDAGGLRSLLDRLAPERLVGSRRQDSRVVASND